MSDRERLAEVRSECHPLCGSTDRHPEDFCHRCGGPNISWYTPGGVWDPVMRPVPGAPWKWHEIICPICFVELAGSGTWALIPRKGDEEPWTSADERAAISAEARAEALRPVLAMADEWDATVYKLPPGYPMTVNEFCRVWFKAPLRAALTAAEPDAGERDA